MHALGVLINLSNFYNFKILSNVIYFRGPLGNLTDRSETLFTHRLPRTYELSRTTSSVQHEDRGLLVEQPRCVPDDLGALQVAVGPGRLFARHAVQAVVPAGLVGHQIAEKQQRVSLGKRARQCATVDLPCLLASVLHVRHAPDEPPEYQHQHDVRHVQAE